jgi:nickel-dependent lactate racemase
MTMREELPTAAWYGDQDFLPAFPPAWEVVVHWPRTLPALTDGQIAGVLDRPVGQMPIRSLCKGISRPLIIVDDLSRPTPASRVMTVLLKHFHDAGIAPEQVRVLMATGTHGPPPIDGMRRKIGSEAAERCRLFVHRHDRDVLNVGKTSFGTPVYVNREVLHSDLVIGIGGMFPSSNLGFSGGSKLALGVLGLRSIASLHAEHKDVQWGVVDRASSFRKDLDEIAKMIGMHTMITIHVDRYRQPVRLVCGDHLAYIEEEMCFARELGTVPAASGADVVICNAYPSDISLTIARNKGTSNFYGCPSSASRILIASCSEGVGYHGLFPLLNAPSLNSRWNRLRRILSMRPAEITRKASARLADLARRTFTPGPVAAGAGASRRHPLWLYRPGEHQDALPSEIAGIQITSSWTDIVNAVHAEQEHRRTLKVVIYPCAPLQCVPRPSTAGKGRPGIEYGTSIRAQDL